MFRLCNEVAGRETAIMWTGQLCRQDQREIVNGDGGCVGQIFYGVRIGSGDRAFIGRGKCEGGEGVCRGVEKHNKDSGWDGRRQHYGLKHLMLGWRRN